LTRELNSTFAENKTIARTTLERAKAAFDTLGRGVLGLFQDAALETQNPERLDALLELVVEARGHYRSGKQWDKSDALRDRLHSVGITLEDTKDGTRWKLD
jgi:cysteinyl-tRNA synthetase